MPEDRQRRLAHNEDIFRQVNDSIQRGQWPTWAGGTHSGVSFRCECARLGCNRLLTLSLWDYERVRSDPRRFVMLAGHELPEVERVVEHRGDVVVVEKTGEAGAEAEREDKQASEREDKQASEREDKRDSEREDGQD